MNSLLILPDEIKLQICQYLDGIDKIQLIKVCQDLQRIGTDRKVLHYLNFQLAYKLSLAELRFLGKSSTICVTILNLNGIHWIPPAALRDTLTRFKNLNALYVLDTQLALRDLVTVMDKAQKIKRLAISLKPDNCADVFKVRIPLQLTHLYVTYNSYSIRSLITLITQFETLEELWMIEPKKPVIYNIPDEMSWSNYVNSPLPCVSKRIVCTRQHPSIGGEQYFFSSLKDTTKKWSQIHFRMTTSVIYVFETADCKNSAICRFFGATFLINNDEVNIGLSVGDTEADRNYVRRWMNPEPEASASSTENKPKENSTTNEFRNILSSGDIKKLLLLLLFSKEATVIRKFQSCSRLFYKTDTNSEKKPVVELFKKRRLSPVSSEIDHDSPFKKFTLYTPNMEDFEINDMDPIGVRDRLWTTDNLIFITNWKMLKKLTITSVNIMNGKFLIEITKNCSMLSCLKIKDEQMQDRMGSHLCEALKYAKNLKDFRYETKGVASIDPLLLALAKCAKLERLFIYCRHTVKISKNPLESVITRCENLIFLFIFIRELPDSTCKSIKQRLNEFGLNYKQIVTVRGQNYTLQNIMYEDIPAVHTEDIISQDNELKICAEYLRTFFYC